MKKIIIMALLSVYAFSLTVSDIEVMRKSGVLIAFPNERKAHTISSDIRPSELIKVSYIRLNDQPLYFVPSWLHKMTNLVRLELKNTKLNLKELAKLKPLTNLNTLDISDNPLFKKGGSLVDVLSRFSLSELYLANTGGDNSDYSNIGSLGSLIKLDLSDNSISDIDGLTLQKLTRLKELSLSNNSISGTLDTSYLPKESLVRLDLSGNKIKKFGFSGNFSSLVALNISNNQTYMEFAEEYNNPYLFASMKNGAFNEDIVLPESIIKRLGIKYEWIDVKASTCITNGGKMSDDGVCEAKWKDAKKICADSKGELPTIANFYIVIKDCGGIPRADLNNGDWGKNGANKSYQSCYKAKGFPCCSYWSSSTYTSDTSYILLVRLDEGSNRISSKMDESSNYVRCVRSRQ